MFILRRKKSPPPPLYGEEQREGLRNAGRFNAQLMDFVREQIAPGVSTGEIDRLVYEYTRDHGHVPACLGYKGYPKSTCISVNEVVCHGIPDGTVLKEGDIVNVDLTTLVEGWHGDQSETFIVGKAASEEARRLVQAAFDALFVGIHAIRPGGRVFDIGRAIYDFARPRGYHVVREYQGHGIGREFHQSPDVPHYPVRATRKQALKPGMCFTVEPMINSGTWRTLSDEADGWTVRTRDGRLSAQFEHTILVTEDGPEILTLTQHGPQEGHRF